MRVLLLLSCLSLVMAADPPAADRFDRVGPQVGDWLPDLPVTRLDGRASFLSQEVRRMTLFVTSSLTCPKSRSRYESLKALAGRFDQHLQVVIVYVIEAHPIVDVCPYKGVVDVTPENQRDGILFRQPTTMAERFDLARGFRERLHVEQHMLVDQLDNALWTAFGGAPNLAVLVDTQRQVRLRQGWYDGTALEGQLRRYFSEQSDDGARERQEKKQATIDHAVEAHLQGDVTELVGQFSRGEAEGLTLLQQVPLLAKYCVFGAHEDARWLLQCAAENGHLAHVAALLAAGANVNAQTTLPPPLHLAAAKGHLEVVTCLLAAGADLNKRSWNGSTAVEEAAFGGQSAMVEHLLAVGAHGSLLVSASRGEVEALTSALVTDPSRAFLTDGHDRTLITFASANGQVAVVEFLLRLGVDPGSGTYHHHPTALQVACERGQTAVVRVLLASRANREASVYGIETPFLCAARHGHLEVVKLLLDAGVKTTERDHIGYAAIHYAAAAGDVELLALLLAHGIDPRLGTHGGYGGCLDSGSPAPLDTPLHLATRHHHLAVMRLLMDHPAGGVAVVNAAGESPAWGTIQDARDDRVDPERLAALDLLLTAGIDLGTEDRHGRTVLDEAIAAGDLVVMNRLRAQGARRGSGVERPPPVASAPKP